MHRSSNKSSTIFDCLSSIGISATSFADCQNLRDEFVVIKKVYFRKILVCHPDKGGDAAIFRDVQTAFEVLRELFEHNSISSFSSKTTSDADNQTAFEAFNNARKDFGAAPTPSWEYYYSAAEEEVPIYRVEPARSNRSACTQKGNAKKCHGAPSLINKGEIRIGTIEKESGAYQFWVHLGCWRVPSKVWLGLPDPASCQDRGLFIAALTKMNEVLLAGFNELNSMDKDMVVDYVMNKSNWARLSTRKPGPTSFSSMTAKDFQSTNSTDASSATPGHDLVPRTATSSRELFEIPVPGRNGVPTNSLAGKTCVLTGIFPELGGGVGLDLGKAKLKKLIETFGGKVTGSVSGKTDILVVGKAPGFSKVSQARSKPRTKIMSLQQLRGGIVGGAPSIEDIKPMAPIQNFSSGYRNNSSANQATAIELKIAAGIAPAPLAAAAAKSTERKPKRKRAAADAAAATVPREKRSRVARKSRQGETNVARKMEASNVMAKQAQSVTADGATAGDDLPLQLTYTVAITCDGCKADCTQRCWLIKKTGEDFCETCYSKIPKTAAGKHSKGFSELQIQGISV